VAAAILCPARDLYLGNYFAEFWRVNFITCTLCIYGTGLFEAVPPPEPLLASDVVVCFIVLAGVKIKNASCKPENIYNVIIICQVYLSPKSIRIIKIKFRLQKIRTYT
jgi:hypothetical protein